MTIEKDNFISENIRKIKTGNNDEIKAAMKAIENNWSKNLGRRAARKRLLFKEFKNELDNFDSIKNINNKVAFVKITKWIILSHGIENYELFSDFFLKTIEHKNGNLRWAVVKSFQALIDNTFFLVVSKERGLSVLQKYTEEEYEKLLLNYCKSVDSIYKLLDQSDTAKYHSYKHIDELPVSVFKSLQQVWNIMLSPTPLKSIYEKYKQEKEVKNLKENYNFDEKDKWDLYYDAMDYLNNDLTEPAKILLNKALKIDKNFVGAEIGFIEAYQMEGNLKERVKHIELAYKKTLKHFPVFPEILEWGEIENRQYFRAIYNKAIYAQEINNLKEAEKFYKLIFKFDPDDHMGIRYYLAGMFAGIMPNGIDDLFEKGNQLQDWSEVENLFIKQNKKHKFYTFPEYEDDEEEEYWSEE